MSPAHGIKNNVLKIAERPTPFGNDGKRRAHARGFIRRHEIESGLADQLFRRVPQQIDHAVRYIDITPFGIDFPDPVGGYAGDIAETLFAVLNFRFAFEHRVGHPPHALGQIIQLFGARKRQRRAVVSGRNRFDVTTKLTHPPGQAPAVKGRSQQGKPQGKNGSERQGSQGRMNRRVGRIDRLGHQYLPARRFGRHRRSDVVDIFK